MFWAFFSYNKNGPSHHQLLETAIEKRQVEEEVKQMVKQMNEEMELILQEEWELNIATS